jgi:hypothetical protein
VTKGGWCMGHGKLPHEHCRWALCDCECHTDKGSRLAEQRDAAASDLRDVPARTTRRNREAR